MNAKGEPQVDNEFYHDLGERWYHAKDNPVALLRAEAKTKNPWVIRKLQEYFPVKAPSTLSILDVGCGAGFLANDLAKAGYQVHGVDRSENSLEVARLHDLTQQVRYVLGDAYSLPFESHTLDAVTCMDFLEHVDSPERVIHEIARVLKPNGIFIFHTFNRNPLCHLVVIKGLEWFVRNTPPHLHVIGLFIKPKELREYCMKVGLQVQSMNGIRPIFSKAFFKMLFSGVVSDAFAFKIVRTTSLSYIGTAVKGA